MTDWRRFSGDAFETLSRMREGLIQLEMMAAKASSFEDRYGNFDMAAQHRRYAALAKKIRMGHPPDDLFTSITLVPDKKP